MYCSRYKKTCYEALYFSCDVPTSSTHIDEQIMDCKDCPFCEYNEENDYE